MRARVHDISAGRISPKTERPLFDFIPENGMRAGVRSPTDRVTRRAEDHAPYPDGRNAEALKGRGVGR